jgi:hypothetical protein
MPDFGNSGVKKQASWNNHIWLWIFWWRLRNPLLWWRLRNPLRPWIFSTVDFFSHPPVGGFLPVDFQIRAVDFDKSGLIFGTPLSRWIFRFPGFDNERKIRQFEKAKSTALFTAKFTATFSRWISKIHRGKKSTNSKSTENPPNSKSTVEKNPPWKKIHQIQNPPWKKIHRGKKSTNSKSTVEKNPPSTFCRFRVHCGE